MKYILWTTLLILSTTGVAFGQCSDADKKALEAYDRDWGKAGDTGNKAALMNIYADDYVGQPGMVGKAETIKNTMAAFERGEAGNNLTHDMYMISCTPNTATITHRNIFTTADAGGKPQTIWTRSVHFLEKRGGKWQVVSNVSHNMDDYMTIGYLEQEWNDAIRTRNKGWFEKNFADDFRGVRSSDGKLMNKAEDIADTVNDKGTTELAETSETDIRIDRNFAVVTGIFRIKGKDEKGAAYDNKIRYVDTWVRRDGRWLAWASAGTRIQ